MLGAFLGLIYDTGMKTKYAATIISLITAFIPFVAPVWAEEALEPESQALYFYAVNVGYKDDISSQNYDYFELRKATEEDLSLEDYQIIYTNSSGNPSTPLSFSEGTMLRGESLVLGFSKSPQYENAPEDYLYTFSSSGLASTSGKLSLYYRDTLEDEICWGKLTCGKQITKFATTEESNYSYVFLDDELKAEKYYPNIVEDALWREVVEPVSVDSCQGLYINEIYSYYESSASEQFVELYNSGDACELNNLSLHYKNKQHALQGNISRGEYLVYQNEALVLTKNPTSEIILEIIDTNDNVLNSVSYPHGQKPGLSYSLFGDEWKLSYARTPGNENIYQEFQTCPEGKEINPETGNCVKIEDSTETVCPEGKYLNPETGRCKTIEDDGLTECAEGYERNPETNRCRKIQTTDASEYAVKTSAETSYSVPKRFAAYGLLILAVIVGLGYLVFQFRFELGKFFRTIFTNLKNLFSRRKKSRAI